MVIRLNFVPGKSGRAARAHIKETVRYNGHRRGRDGQRISRPYFGWDRELTKEDIYQMIDNVEKGTIFSRFKISPDPKRENPEKTLNLQELTRCVMRELEARKGRGIQFIGNVHDDHTDIPHVHAVVLFKGRIDPEDIRAMREVAKDRALIEQGLSVASRERGYGRQAGNRSFPFPLFLPEAQERRGGAGYALAGGRQSYSRALSETHPCPTCLTSMEGWQEFCANCGYERGQEFALP